MIVIYTVLVALTLYAGITLFLAAKFLSSSSSRIPAADVPVSIVICARNEASHIIPCLDGISKQIYPQELIEIVLVNDASSDNTGSLAASFLRERGIKHSIITNPIRKGKKRSLQYAIGRITTGIIVCRDADTTTGSEHWLRSVVSGMQHGKAEMCAAPVEIRSNTGLLWALQAIEIRILMMITGGSIDSGMPFLCNGANLAFTKSLFDRTSGYLSHIHIESGDDVLFMGEAHKAGAKIVFAHGPEAVVQTYPCTSLTALIRQRTRWASKFRITPGFMNAFTAVLVFVVNAGWIFSFIFMLMYPDNQSAVICVLLKPLIDFLLLFLASMRSTDRSLLWYALPVSFIYPVYAVIIALSAVFAKPAWNVNEGSGR